MDYVANGKQILLRHANEDLTHFGDADSPEGATEIVEALNAMGKRTQILKLEFDPSEVLPIIADHNFDYVAEAEQTLSHEWHGDMVAKHVWTATLNNAITALTQLDKIKKTLFYGRDNNLIADGQRNISDLPILVGQTAHASGYAMYSETAADYIHGVLGVATEAGELLEGLRDTINGKPYDPVNIKEECGDVKWYQAILSRVAGFVWGEDERRNIEKLRARYPEKFTEYDANNRNLAAERDILEGQASAMEGHDADGMPIIGNEKSD